MKRLSKINSGYTLLFATLIAALVLGVVVFIIGVARKQYLLSSTARDSIYSFYAAQSAMECMAQAVAHNWPIYDPGLTDGSGNPVLEDTQVKDLSIPINCANNLNINYTFEPVSTNLPFNPGSAVVYSASTSIGFANPGDDLTISSKLWGCANITTYFYVDTDPVSGSKIDTTVIMSRGYNLCTYNSNVALGPTYGPDLKSSRTVERAIQWVSLVPE